ncbi:hypothetical protein E2C01_012707 [Portunus trituberculatus]|uniref:Uncharacterized protein n=1 Tax=Portunus trituberculatus TaxID=210409 RepID=A0A5B7DEF0_PORTR|nr:hypothetical protein [Portunus trituberculatus]
MAAGRHRGADQRPATYRQAAAILSFCTTTKADSLWRRIRSGRSGSKLTLKITECFLASSEDGSLRCCRQNAV